jgi:hypothetical protein
MDFQHVIVKIPVDGELAVEPAVFIDTFHRWVAEQVMPELLIDVADLRHVPAGPGVILVGLQADYALDHTDNRWGLLYRRKDVVAGTNADRVQQALGAVAAASRRIERELDGRVTFSRATFDVTINDRALAPNTAETRASAVPELRTIIAGLVGHDGVQVGAHDADPRRRFGVTITTARPFDLDALARG